MRANNTNSTHSILNSVNHDDWTPWGDNDSLPTNPGNYSLATDVTLTSTWAVPAGETNLCLDRHVINPNDGAFSVITVGSNVTFNLYDCDTETTHPGYIGTNGVLRLGTPLGSEPVHNITGGVITGGKATGGAGGGVNITSSTSTFNMYGGTIAGNQVTSKSHGGAVRSNDTLNMSGGVIEYNYGHQPGGADYLFGGTFIMKGGEISNNVANESGGGFFISNSATFTMTGGTITGNTAAKANQNGYVSFVTDNLSAFVIAKPRISLLWLIITLSVINVLLAGGIVYVIVKAKKADKEKLTNHEGRL